jgi:dihydroflavonol-4-reductase
MILVSGGTGLVGSHLLYDLCQKQRVRAIKRHSSDVSNVKKVFSYYSDKADELLNNIEWVDGDVSDIYSLMEAMDGISHVYHCAAMVSFDAKNAAAMDRINVVGTENMVNAALGKGVAKFCHVSSIAAIGMAPQGDEAHEETFWKSSPENSNYSISKYGAEREVWRAANEGLDVIVVNPSLILGPGNWQQSSSNIFSKSYKGILFYSDGSTGFVDVRDVAALMIKLMESDVKNERFIIHAENMKYKTFFDLIHEAFNKPKPSIKAGNLLSEFAWIAEAVRCYITGNNPLITRETARSAHKQNKYSHKKIMGIFPNYQFIPINESINTTCKLFLQDISTLK